ncbi:helix-turn-helix transcriptional regulator [Micromonospora sp. Llam7]|uniref:helix-turn-helix domain-containing protein n=1 Tax=Micromonospora tarapacensis TaxID=2835305 RepID=UPI001C83CDC8|nr:helix-turn-helix transcriptional regulator [Micromonospora tarapacensis]MBX7269117.1 helix-turn-helix transcriptional regulator [Micromonospora tarapacensis]
MSNAIDYVREELRLLRAHLRMSQDEFGRVIGYSGSHASSVETGGRPPTKDYMLAVDRAHDPAFNAEAAEGRFTWMLRELSKLEQTPSWLREWIELEREATLLRWYEPAFLPGVFQREAYARATMNDGLLLPDQIEQRVASRLDRQAILTRDVPVPVVAVLDAMVLRRGINGHPDITREQIEHLVKISELPHVQILVVPEETGICSGLQRGFILATLSDGSVVAHLDHQVRAQIVNHTDDLATLQRTWEAVRGEALPRRQSLELIKEAAQTWT